MTEIETETYEFLRGRLGREVVPWTILNRGFGAVVGAEADDMFEDLQRALAIKARPFDYDRYFGAESFFGFLPLGTCWPLRGRRRDPLSAEDLAAHFYKSQLWK
jgi:hypothetical protein